MLNNILNKERIGNNPLIQQQEIQSIGKGKILKTPYAKNDLLVDESDISDEAVKLYEKDKDIQKYKGLVLDSLDTDNGVKEIAGLIESGKLDISDSDIAQAMMGDDELMDYLF